MAPRFGGPGAHPGAAFLCTRVRRGPRPARSSPRGPRAERFGPRIALTTFHAGTSCFQTCHLGTSGSGGGAGTTAWSRPRTFLAPNRSQNVRTGDHAHVDPVAAVTHQHFSTNQRSSSQGGGKLVQCLFASAYGEDSAHRSRVRSEARQAKEVRGPSPHVTSPRVRRTTWQKRSTFRV